MTNPNEDQPQPKSPEQIPSFEPRRLAAPALHSTDWGPTHHRVDYELPVSEYTERPDDN